MNKIKINDFTDLIIDEIKTTKPEDCSGEFNGCLACLGDGTLISYVKASEVYYLKPRIKWWARYKFIKKQ